MAAPSVGAATLALGGDPHCGDQWGFWPTRRGAVVCIADGLGHGRFAERAGKAAVSYVARCRAEPLARLFAGCDRALRSTRGVALGVAVIDDAHATVTYAGVGNTRALLGGGGPKTFSSTYGIVGAGYRPLAPETVPLGPGDLLVLFTDGVDESVPLARYPGDLRRDPQGLAEAILADHGRVTDDAAVVVYRHGVP